MSNSNDSDTEDIGDDESVCVICGGMPCEWEKFGGELISRQSLIVRRVVDDDGAEDLIDSAGWSIPNSKMWLYLYCLFTYLKFGHLGRGNRIPIPSCVTTQIRNLYPDPTYTEFCQACERNLERASRRKQEQQREESKQVEEDKQEEDKEEDEDYVDDEEESEDEE